MNKLDSRLKKDLAEVDSECTYYLQLIEEQSKIHVEEAASRERVAQVRDELTDAVVDTRLGRAGASDRAKRLKVDLAGAEQTLKSLEPVSARIDARLAEANARIGELEGMAATSITSYVNGFITMLSEEANAAAAPLIAILRRGEALREAMPRSTDAHLERLSGAEIFAYGSHLFAETEVDESELAEFGVASEAEALRTRLLELSRRAGDAVAAQHIRSLRAREATA